jgi:hypothetical protein
MEQSATQLFKEGAALVAHADEEQIETVARRQAQHFEQLCHSLQGGDDAYIHYRILSAFCHPSALLTDFYLEPDDTIPSGCRLRLEPKQLEHDGWLFLNVAAMLWALRAWDDINITHPLWSALRLLARELEVPEALNVTARQAGCVPGRQAAKASYVEGPRKKANRDRT